MSLQNMIERHAYLTAGISRQEAAGRPIPAAAKNELERIEKKASAMLTPDLYRDAMIASHSMQAQFHVMADMQESEAVASAQLYAKEVKAKGLSGMDLRQIDAAKKGEAMPQKGSKLKPPKAKAAIEQAAKALNKDMTFKKFAKVADEASNAQWAGRDEAHLDSIIENAFPGKLEEGRQLCEAFINNGMNHTLRLLDGQTDPDTMVQPTADETLRAQITDAALDHLASGMAVHESYREDPGLRGVIAKAYEEQRVEEIDRDDPSSYRGTDYDQDQLDGSMEHAQSA